MTFLSYFVSPSFSAPVLTPEAPAAESEVLDAHPSSGSSAAPIDYWSEEADRRRAAHFVNAAADALLRSSLGALCTRTVCALCGITFLAMSRSDVLCHVCVSEGVR